MNTPLLQMLSKAREVNLLIDGFTLPVNLSFPIPELQFQGTKETAVNAFKLQDGKWVLRFDGRETRLKDSVGLHYIHALLHQQGRFIDATALVARAPGDAVDCVGEADLQDGEDEGHFLSIDSHFKDEILPDQGRKWLLKRLEELRGEVEAARANGETEEAETGQEQIDRIEQFLRKHRFRSHNATFITQAERDRKSVGAAMGRALLLIGRTHPTLARHLENSIEKGSQCCYRPEKETSWNL